MRLKPAARRLRQRRHAILNGESRARGIGYVFISGDGNAEYAHDSIADLLVDRAGVGLYRLSGHGQVPRNHRVQRLVLQLLRKAGRAAKISEEDRDGPSLAGCEILASCFPIDLRIRVCEFLVRPFGQGRNRIEYESPMTDGSDPMSRKSSGVTEGRRPRGCSRPSSRPDRARPPILPPGLRRPQRPNRSFRDRRRHEPLPLGRPSRLLGLHVPAQRRERRQEKIHPDEQGLTLVESNALLVCLGSRQNQGQLLPGPVPPNQGPPGRQKGHSFTRR